MLSSEESYLRSLDVLAHRVQALDSLQGAERDAITRFLDAGEFASEIARIGKACWRCTHAVPLLQRGPARCAS